MSNRVGSIYTMNELHEISPSVEKIYFFQFSIHWDQIVYTRCRIGHFRMTHKFLILGEDPPTCSLCQIPLSIKHVLLDCANFNSVRTFFIQLTLLKRFLTELKV